MVFSSHIVVYKHWQLIALCNHTTSNEWTEMYEQMQVKSAHLLRELTSNR